MLEYPASVRLPQCRLTVEKQGSNAEGPAEADLWSRVCSHQV